LRQPVHCNQGLIQIAIHSQTITFIVDGGYLDRFVCIPVGRWQIYINGFNKLTLRIFNLCIFIAMSVYSYCMFMYLNRASWHSSATLTEIFPCFFLSCKANARVKSAKKGQGSQSSKIFVLFYVLIVLCRSVYCLRVNVYCTTVTGWLPNCS
jgi:hypothetical protein